MRVYSKSKIKNSAKPQLQRAAAAVLEPMEKRVLMSSTITAWTFDNNSIANNNSPAPSTGSGTASSIGMNIYATPNVGVTTDDVVLGKSSDTGSNGVADTTNVWRVRAQAGSSGAANGWSSQAPIGAQGAVFNASTTGYTGISVKFDWYATSSGEANLQFEYTTDGVHYTNAPITLGGSDSGLVALTNSTSANTVMGAYVSDNALVNGSQAGQDWFTGLTVNISDSAAANNPNFAFELVNASTGADCVSAAGTALNNTSGNWRFDNVQVLGTAYVSAPPTITTNPSNQTVNLGNPVTFTSAATGYPTPITVQWYESTDGGATFNSVGSAGTSPNYTFTPTTVTGSTLPEFEASYTNTAGTTNTSAATLTVNSATPPVITTNPATQTVTAGATVNLTAAATATPALTGVQWYSEPSGASTYTAISGATSTTYSFTAAPANDGTKYEASFTNAGGTTNTSAATLTVQYAPIVTTQPLSQNITQGNTVTFTAAASADPAYSVQWQSSTGGAYTNIAGATNASYGLTVTDGLANTSYRAVFSNSIGSTPTNAATLSVVGVPIAQWIFTSTVGLTPATNLDDSQLTTDTNPADGGLGSGNAPLPTFTDASGSNTDNAQTLGLFNDYQSIPVVSGADISNVPGQSTVNPSFDPYSWRIRSGHAPDGWSQLAPELTTVTAGGYTLDPQGVLFRVDTTGYKDITLHFDWDGGGIADMQPQYSIDGTNWTNVGPILQNFSKDYPGITPTTTPPGFNVNMEASQYASAFNSSSFELRLVAAYDPNLPMIVDGNGYQNASNPDSLHGQYASSSAGAQNAQQVLNLGTSAVDRSNNNLNGDGTPGESVLSGGTYQLSFGGYTTGLLSYNAAPLDVQNALQALPSIGSGNVTVADTQITPFTNTSDYLQTITFTGSMAKTPEPTIAVVNPTVTYGNGTLAPVTVETWVNGISAAGTDANGYQTGVTRFVDGNGTWNLSDFSFNGITINGAPAVTTQPANTAVVGGTSASFTAVDYSETTPVSAEWQVNTGSGFTNYSAGTYNAATSTASLSVTTLTNLSDNGYQYRVIFTNANGSTTSNAATLSVVAPVAPSVTTQPAAVAVQVGNVATFTAAATGSPAPTVSWQVSTGSSWTNLTDGYNATTGINVHGSQTNTLAVTTSAAQDGSSYQYRAVFTNVLQATPSNPATLTVLTPETTIAGWNFNLHSASYDNNPAPTTGVGTATALGFTLPYFVSDAATNDSGTATIGSVNADDVTSTAGAANPAYVENLWRVRGGINATTGGSGTVNANGWSNYAQEYTQGVEFAASTVGVSNVYVTLDWYSTTSGELNARQQYTLDGVNWYNLDDQHFAWNGSTNSVTGLDDYDPSDPNPPLSAFSNDYYGAGPTYSSTAITSASLTNNVATLTASNSYSVGQTVNVKGVTPSSFNGIYTITAATSTTFSYALTGTNVNPTTQGTSAAASLGGYVVPLVFNLTNVAGAANNPNFAIRVVNAYNPTLPTINTVLYNNTMTGIEGSVQHGQYAVASSAASPTAYPGQAGNWRFGNVVFHAVVTTPAWLYPASVASGAATWLPASHTLQVTGPTNIIGDPGTDEPIIVGSGPAAQVVLNTSGGTVNLGGVNITGGAGLTVANNAGQQVVVIAAGTTGTSLFTVGSKSTLNLGDNALDLQASNASQGAANTTLISSYLQNGYASGAWNGTRISSTNAANDAGHLTALGMLYNLNPNTNAGYYSSTPGSLGEFDGVVNPGANDVLVRYTYYGDANLSGAVDGSDYSVIDASYNSENFQNGAPTSQMSGWYNGDFNFDGVVDGSDYTLIDNAFNSQDGDPLAQVAAQPAAQIATVKPAKSSILSGRITGKAPNLFAGSVIAATGQGGAGTILDLANHDKQNSLVTLLDGLKLS
jgi:hypothetical protein